MFLYIISSCIIVICVHVCYCYFRMPIFISFFYLSLSIAVKWLFVLGVLHFGLDSISLSDMLLVYIFSLEVFLLLCIYKACYIYPYPFLNFLSSHLAMILSLYCIIFLLYPVCVLDDSFTYKKWWINLCWSVLKNAYMVSQLLVQALRSDNTHQNKRQNCGISLVAIFFS